MGALDEQLVPQRHPIDGMPSEALRIEAIRQEEGVGGINPQQRLRPCELRS